MELDPFCESAISLKKYTNFIKYDTKFRPKTGDREVDNIYILASPGFTWNEDLGRRKRTGYISFSLMFNGSRKLGDIGSYYSNMKTGTLLDYVLLHNYCCKRLREELNKIFPDKHFGSTP